MYKKKTAQHNDKFYFRSSLVTAFLVVFFCLILGRLSYLQIYKGQVSRQQAEKQHSVYQKLLPSRGEILLFDRVTMQTLPLATNYKAFLVYAVPQEILQANQNAVLLAYALNLDEKELFEKLNNKSRKYVVLKKQLSEQEQDKIKNLRMDGIYLDSEDTRIYPEKNLLSQVLGYVGFKTDVKEGIYGLEQYFNNELAGKIGELKTTTGNGGSWIAGTPREVIEARDGISLVLTIDKTIQFKAENLLKTAVEKNQADSGSVIVANPKTGSILAMASYPDFDPNEYSKTKDVKNFINETTLASYEPGSIFKPITMAAAINEGKITPETTYEDTGSVVIDDYTIKNSDNKVHGKQNMIQVLDNSLNTGAIFAKNQIGNKVFLKYLQNFGFGKATGIELPEQNGSLSNLKNNINVNYGTASFGQGILATPIQMIQAYTAIANGGKMMKPYIVQAKYLADGSREETKPQSVADVISAKTANTVSTMLVDVVENGHGKKAAVPGYWIAGKTGTAQVARKDGKAGYEENNNIGSFIGFGPVEDPQFLMIVRIDHPKDVSYAETTAAPVFGELAQFLVSYLHIPPTRK